MQKICAKFVPRVLREDQKERRCHDSRQMVKLIVTWSPTEMIEIRLILSSCLN